MHGDGTKRAAQDTEFKTKTIAKILEDNLFTAYLQMMIQVHWCLTCLAGWCEQCYCHEDELSTNKKRARGLQGLPILQEGRIHAR